MTAPTFLIFDLESTGNRFHGDYILELGAIAIDAEFKPHEKYSALVHVPMSLVNEALDNQSKRDGTRCTLVREMHTTNHLLRDLAVTKEETHTQTRRTQPAAAYREASVRFCDWLAAQGYERGQVILVGHSIATFDYPFLKVAMPLVFDWLSHRTQDFGGISRFLREQCKAPIPQTPKEEWPHRALADCEIELAEAQACIRMTTDAFTLLNRFNITMLETQLDAPFENGEVP